MLERGPVARIWLKLIGQTQDAVFLAVAAVTGGAVAACADQLDFAILVDADVGCVVFEFANQMKRIVVCTGYREILRIHAAI